MIEPVAANVVCDAGPLIHLDELGCLSLLGDFARVLVPEIVWSEAASHRREIWERAGFEPERIRVSGSVIPEIQAAARVLMLHAGEIAALQLARETPGSLFFTDDTAARLAAKQLSLPVHGTIGILLRAIRRQQKSAKEVVELLRILPERSTLHVTRDLLAEALRAAEERL